ncbi:hypothetical protein PR048_019457 [Dryococelus australis]|uniref:Uncharacterized protein n=1 Tax=Dryococelus australis TaxID=614101 RepID=A0ABQ9H3J3_9NEOP|nr:hypothetical protein PR048_019457 [Dryococelus australis]
MVDYYSKWVELQKLKRQTSHFVIKYLKNNFVRFGITAVVMSDGGSNFTLGITLHPDHEETPKKAAVDKELELVLLETRNTLSPSQLLMGRLLRTFIPVKQQKYYYDKHGRTEEPPLSGAVRVQTSKGWLQSATIIRSADRPRLNAVKMPNGNIVERSANVLCSDKTNGRKSMYYDYADIRCLEGGKAKANHEHNVNPRHDSSDVKVLFKYGFRDFTEQEGHVNVQELRNEQATTQGQDANLVGNTFLNDCNNSVS